MAYVIIGIYAALGIAALVATIHGLVLAFSASVLLGVIVLICEPSLLFIGLAYWFFGANLAEMIMKAVS